jgi:DNA-binding transcriptional MerR regulator
MYQISELAESVGLSRATLLYYEKLGLLKGKRQANGYRVYTDADRQRLRLMQQLQAGGLSLQECQACLDGKLDREMLGQRLAVLDAEIAEKGGRGTSWRLCSDSRASRTGTKRSSASRPICTAPGSCHRGFPARRRGWSRWCPRT